MRRLPAIRPGIPAEWRVPVAIAAVALVVAAGAGWQARDMDTGPGSVQLGRGLFTLLAAGGIALALGVAAMAARHGSGDVARAIVLSVVALVVGYLVAYAIAPGAGVSRSNLEMAVLLPGAQPT